MCQVQKERPPAITMQEQLMSWFGIRLNVLATSPFPPGRRKVGTRRRIFEEEVNMRDALLQAGVSEAQVEGVVQNLELRNLALGPAPAPPVAEDIALAAPGLRVKVVLDFWRFSVFSPLGRGQLEALRRVLSLSQIDIDALGDIVERCFRIQRCCGITIALCLAVFVVSCIGLFLSGKGDYKIGDPDPPLSGITALVSIVLVWPLFPLMALTTPSGCRQVTQDLNQHFRGHALNLCFEVIVQERSEFGFESAWRLVVSSETGADGIA